MLYKFNGHYNVDMHNKGIVKVNRQKLLRYDFNFLWFLLSSLTQNVSYCVQFAASTIVEDHKNSITSTANSRVANKYCRSLLNIKTILNKLDKILLCISRKTLTICPGLNWQWNLFSGVLLFRKLCVSQLTSIAFMIVSIWGETRKWWFRFIHAISTLF